MNKKQLKIEDFERFKKELKVLLGKDENLGKNDFEAFLNKKYRCIFYNSVEAYMKATYSDIKVGDPCDCVDYLAFDIIKSGRYRVALIAKKETSQKIESLIYYSFDGDTITDMFFQYGELENQCFWGIFEPNGENLIRKNIK